MIHTLTDETYALLNSITEYPEDTDKASIQFYIQPEIFIKPKFEAH